MLKITELKIQTRRSPSSGGASWREYQSKPRCYVFPTGEGVMENLFVGRRNRPVDLYKREVLPVVKAALAVKATEVLNRPVDASEFTTNWSQKAGCSCGCSPGFIVTGPWIGNIDVVVDVAAANDAAAVIPEAKGALDAFRASVAELQAAATQRTGRSGSGNLRNFRAMSDEKLQDTLGAVRIENNDPEALEALVTEATGRLTVNA